MQLMLLSTQLSWIIGQSSAMLLIALHLSISARIGWTAENGQMYNRTGTLLAYIYD